MSCEAGCEGWGGMWVSGEGFLGEGFLGEGSA